jgi:hypothetical protein
MKTQLNFRQFKFTCAKQAGNMPTYWSVNSLGHSDRTPEIILGFREGAGYA